MKKKKSEKVTKITPNKDGTVDISTKKSLYKGCYMNSLPMGIGGYIDKKGSVIIEEISLMNPKKKRKSK